LPEKKFRASCEKVGTGVSAILPQARINMRAGLVPAAERKKYALSCNFIGDAVMLTLFPQAMPIHGLLGGLLIGFGSAIMLLGLGRIAGVSGLAARSIGLANLGTSRLTAFAFIIGLPLGAFLASHMMGPITVRFQPSTVLLVLGGLLVGFGTRLGSGCTSGHGVCGLSRLSRRSMVATAIFMASGFATVAAMRAWGIL
jgi:uncharacterized protein